MPDLKETRLELTPEMIEAGIAVDRWYAAQVEADESERVKSIFEAMMEAKPADVSD